MKKTMKYVLLALILISLFGCKNEEVTTTSDKDKPVVVKPPVESEPKVIISEKTYGLFHLKLIGKEKYAQGEELDIVLEVTYLGDDELTFISTPNYHVFTLESVEGEPILEGIQELSCVEHLIEPDVVKVFEIDELKTTLDKGSYTVTGYIYIGLGMNQSWQEFRFSREITFEVIS